MTGLECVAGEAGICYKSYSLPGDFGSVHPRTYSVHGTATYLMAHIIWSVDLSIALVRSVIHGKAKLCLAPASIATLLDRLNYVSTTYYVVIF